MIKRILQCTTLSLFGAVLMANSGCSSADGSCFATNDCGTKCKTTKVATRTTRVKDICEKPAGEVTAELPPNARPGECFAKVWVPPEFKTVTERVMVKEATERLEVIPAEYEWVEERILVKDASTRLIEEPAEYASKQVVIQTEAGHTDWEINKDANCELPPKTPAKDVFCLVNHPPEKVTLNVQCQVKPPTVREEVIAAEYETVRRHKLVSPATTRRICIPAEFDTVDKTVKVCDGRMAWKRVVCEKPYAESVTINANGKASQVQYMDQD
ncbi:MAG TPA: hypothetical protein VNT79_01090 [Phycisphaerae bacterium]|nr:hypothetical protein [Phycisphaerae bacterium]